ncbi:MAG: PDZ domain-containing protein, partial [Candidatus Kapaibacterium sp.]
MKKLVFILLLAFVSSSVFSQNITRKAFMGVRVSAINDSIKSSLNLSTKEGLLITTVTAGSTAENATVKVNDVLIKINGVNTNSVKAYRDAVKTFREKDEVTFAVIRGKESLVLNSLSIGLPYEKSDKYDVVYDEVKFKNGYLRIITTKPKSSGKFKTVLFIPGYMCYSLDNLGKHPYGQFVDKLSEKGYAVARIEKSGMGDCVNTPDCFEIDYTTELEGFETGFQKIIEYDFVDKDNVFIFGHSLGGYQAPMIDKNKIAKGVIVCGTGLKTWYEYILEMFRFQNPIMGVDYVENEKVVTKMINILYDYLVMKKHPKDVAVNDEIKSMMKDYLEFDGGEMVWSRNYRFWQELQDLNMPQVWKDVKANVLVIRGEGDIEAFSNVDHQDII